MKSYLKILSLGAVLAASPLHAALVTLTDGSSLSGEIKEQANGDVVVATGAGEITVAKDKIRSVVKDASAGSAQAEAGVDNSYVEGVLARRAKYGNKDGLPHTQNLQKDQLAVTVGQLNYTGDAYTSLSSDLSGISYGLAYAHSYTDWVALEIWGDYSYVSKDFAAIPGVTATVKLQRYNVGIGPKVQKAFALGGPEQSISLIPSIGLTPAWSSVSAGINGGSTMNSSSLGASLNVGLDFQFGGALIGAKYRYLVSTDVSGSGLKSSNTGAGIPELAVGFAF